MPSATRWPSRSPPLRARRAEHFPPPSQPPRRNRFGAPMSSPPAQKSAGKPLARGGTGASLFVHARVSLPAGAAPPRRGPPAFAQQALPRFRRLRLATGAADRSALARSRGPPFGASRARRAAAGQAASGRRRATRPAPPGDGGGPDGDADGRGSAPPRAPSGGCMGTCLPHSGAGFRICCAQRAVAPTPGASEPPQAPLIQPSAGTYAHDERSPGRGPQEKG